MHAFLFRALLLYRRWLACALALTLSGLAFASLVSWESPSFRHPANPCFLEARSLLKGRIELPERVHDTALFNGKALNPFQPGQTLLFAAMFVAGRGVFPNYYQLGILAVAICTAAFLQLALLQLSGGKSAFSALLTISVLCGAPYLTNLPGAYYGSVYRVNHCIALLFISALLALLHGRASTRKLFLAGLCIGMCTLFRLQHILLLLLPLMWMLHSPDGLRWHAMRVFSNRTLRTHFCKGAAALCVMPALALATVMTFQAVRFGNPLEAGYGFIYEGRTDYLALRAAEHGIMSIRFLPENLYRTFLATPEIEFQGWSIRSVKGDPRGNALLFSQPILLLLLCASSGLHRARVQALLLSSLILALPVWLYHNPGVHAPGYMRYGLDYLFVWAATLAASLEHEELPEIARILLVPMSFASLAYALLLLTS
jgi:hypothetical protein